MSQRSLKDELRHLIDYIEDEDFLKATITMVQEYISAVSKADDIDNENNHLRSEVSDLNDQVNSYEGEVATLKEQITQLEADIAEAYLTNAKY